MPTIGLVYNPTDRLFSPLPADQWGKPCDRNDAGS